MVMTKRDFERIATAFRENLDECSDDPVATLALTRGAWAIADVCAESNTRFDRHRFLVACGVES